MGLPRWRSVVRVVFLASLLVLATAEHQPPPPPRRIRAAPGMSADGDAILARACDPRGSSRPVPWCREPRLRRRRRHRPSPLAPPGRDEEVDARYGVAKRLVPTGPNPLHN